MIKHHGVGSAGQAQDGAADGDGSRGNREQRTGAAEAVPAVGGGRPGGVGRDRGGGSYVNGDRAIGIRPVRQVAGRNAGREAVAGVDGETGQNSDIASRGGAGSEDGGAAKVVAGGSSVGPRGVGDAAEGCNFRIGRAPGEGRSEQGGGIGDAVQGIDCGSRDGCGATVV